MSFQIVSDIHIEKINDNNPNPLTFLTPRADILLLPGDIGSLYKQTQLQNFLQSLSKLFKYVLYTPGNQEYYTIENIPPESFETLNKRLRAIEASIPNLFVLNRNNVLIEDVCIAGCTLWSNPRVELPSYFRIHGMTTDAFQELFDNDVEHLEQTVEYCKNKKYRLLIMTHYCPTFSVFKTKKDLAYEFISLYASNLDYMLNKKEHVEIWVCGHIHQNFDFALCKDGTRIVGNQHGKITDVMVGYRKDFTIQIE